MSTVPSCFSSLKFYDDGEISSVEIDIWQIKHAHTGNLPPRPAAHPREDASRFKTKVSLTSDYSIQP